MLVMYCDKEFQKAHWRSEHRKRCSKIVSDRAAAVAGDEAGLFPACYREWRTRVFDSLEMKVLVTSTLLSPKAACGGMTGIDFRCVWNPAADRDPTIVMKDAVATDFGGFQFPHISAVMMPVFSAVGGTDKEMVGMVLRFLFSNANQTSAADPSAVEMEVIRFLRSEWNGDAVRKRQKECNNRGARVVHLELLNRINESTENAFQDALSHQRSKLISPFATSYSLWVNTCPRETLDFH